MKSKITLITPPDIFENANKSILFCHLDDEEQSDIGRWLQIADLPYDLNLYTFMNDNNPVWFLYALNRCEHKYINMNGVNMITQALSGYALSRSNVYYKTDSDVLGNIFGHINSNRVSDVKEFLERVLGAKTSET